MISDMVKNVIADKSGEVCIVICYRAFNKFNIDDIVFAEHHPDKVSLGEFGEAECNFSEFANHFKVIFRSDERLDFNILLILLKGYCIISGLSFSNNNINFVVGDDKISIFHSAEEKYIVTRTSKDTPNVAHCDDVEDVLDFFEMIYSNELEAGKVLRTNYKSTAIGEFARQNQFKLAICKGLGPIHIGYKAGDIVAWNMMDAGTSVERVRVFTNPDSLDSYEDITLSSFEDFFISIHKGSLLHQDYVTTVVNTIFGNNLFQVYSTSACTFYNIVCGNKRVSIHLDRFGFTNADARVFISTCSADEKMVKCTDLHDLVILLSNIKEDSER